MVAFIKNSTFSPRISEISKPHFGIPNLDDILEISLSTVNVFYESEDSHVHKNLLPIFTSSSLKSKKDTFVLSAENSNFIYYETQSRQSDQIEKPNLIIAWRYKNLKMKDAPFIYDISEKIPLQENCRLKNIEELILKMKNTKDCRFCIFGLFSPLLGLKNSKNEIYKILYDIRKYTKINNHVVFMSIPIFFNPDIKFSQFFDNIIQLHADLSLVGQKSIYSAIFEIKKRSLTNSLLVNELESFKYGLRMRSTNVILELIDIPPEENQNSGGCGINF